MVIKFTKLKEFLQGVFQIKKTTWEQSMKIWMEKSIWGNIKYKDVLFIGGLPSTDFFIKLIIPGYSLLKASKGIYIYIYIPTCSCYIYIYIFFFTFSEPSPTFSPNEHYPPNSGSVRVSIPLCNNSQTMRSLLNNPRLSVSVA